MKFWKVHTAFRLFLMMLFFAAGIICTVWGWKMTGRLAGLGIMIAGLAMILASLWLYNLPFQTPKFRKERKKNVPN